MADGKRAINIGAGALARGFVMPALLATPRGWSVALASRRETSDNREWLDRMAANGAVVKHILEEQLPLLPGEEPEPTTAVWSGDLEAFHDTSTPEGLAAAEQALADPRTALLVLNARHGFDALADGLLATIRRRRGSPSPLLVVCCDNTPPASWAAFRDACDAEPLVSAVSSVSDRMCVDGATLSLLRTGTYKPGADVYTERWRHWYIERDSKGIAEQLGLDRGDHANGITLVDDLRPYVLAKRYLMNAPHFATGAMAAAQGEPFLDTYVAAEESDGPPIDGIELDMMAPRDRCRGLVDELRVVTLLEFETMAGLELDDPQGFVDDWADRTLHRLERFPAYVGYPIRALHPPLDDFWGQVEDRLRRPTRLFEAGTGTAAEHLRTAIDAAEALVNANAWEWL